MPAPCLCKMSILFSFTQNDIFFQVIMYKSLQQTCIIAVTFTTGKELNSFIQVQRGDIQHCVQKFCLVDIHRLRQQIYTTHSKLHCLNYMKHRWMTPEITLLFTRFGSLSFSSKLSPTLPYLYLTCLHQDPCCVFFSHLKQLLFFVTLTPYNKWI
jgi:hypothetical protein